MQLEPHSAREMSSGQTEVREHQGFLEGPRRFGSMACKEADPPLPSYVAKVRLRAELARLIVEFLAAGGVIVICPAAGRGAAPHAPAQNAWRNEAARNGGKVMKWRTRARVMQYEARTGFDFEERREIRSEFLAGREALDIAQDRGADVRVIKRILEPVAKRLTHAA